MIKKGTKVKLVVQGSEVAGKVVDIDNNSIALVEIMRMGNWHYHCGLDQLEVLSAEEEKRFYSRNKNK